jgi:putative ABC transport system permease protein
VLGFCVLVSMLTGIVFGLVPALESSKPNLVESLKDDARGSSSWAGGRFRASLVVAEVALAVVLLVSGGLTLRSFIALQKVDLGFHSAQVTTLDIPHRRYATLEQRNQFSQDLLEHVRNLPGVEAAQIGNGGLPFGGPTSKFGLEGRDESDADSLVCNLVSADYLKTLGIRIMAGRMFDEVEVQRGDRVVVVNETTARLWPAGVDPIGKRLRVDLLQSPGGPVLVPTNASPYVTVIGVVADTRNDGIRNVAKPAALLPYTLVAPPGRTLALRTSGDSAPVISALRTYLRQIDPQQPLQNPQPLEAALLNQKLQPRFIMALFTLFAGFGLTLAAMGIYSVLSYLVTRRTREIGVRVALGAQSRDIIKLIFGSGGRLVGVGIVAGVLLSFVAARLLDSQLNLFRVTTTDPTTFLSVIALIGLVAGAACFIPARRAAKVDPMVALRQE